MPPFARDFFDLLADPIDRKPFRLKGHELIAENGAHYPIVAGIPVLLRSDVAHTHPTAVRTLRFAAWAKHGVIGLLDTVNLPEATKSQIRAEIAEGDWTEAVIKAMIPNTNGLAYRGVQLREIPIPTFPDAGGERLLDVGCAWGRWTLAAYHAGFRAIGVDTALGPLMAAKQLAKQSGADVHFICGDTRYLPFRSETFDRVFSYSTLQHFDDDDCQAALADIARVLIPSGRSRIQMANRAGPRSLWHQLGRGFRKPRRFEVRYRSLSQLRALFSNGIGPTEISADCFFGLGLQLSEIAHMRLMGRIATAASEILKRMPQAQLLADSVFCISEKMGTHQMPSSS